MKCSNCNVENQKSRKFCRECGSKLILICPSCGYQNFPEDKFCGECGKSLASSAKPEKLSIDQKISKIQKYLPEGLTEKILAQRDRIEGEKKQITIMFCDLENFTPLAEKLGPEDIFTLMDQVYEILIHKVNEFEGTVNELTGDGIMALFGAPIAMEGAPQKAIRSALAIHREIHDFSDRMTNEKGLPSLRMRIGIHSGPVVVGTVGNDLRVDFKAIGDTVNLASRMESMAEPGTICVTEEIFKLSEGFFRFENLGVRKVKGKDDPVQTYRVISPSSLKTRFDVNAEKGLTPLVAREREIEFLLDAFRRAKNGNGQALSIVSDAGLGKSRLLYEFRKAVSNENLTFLEGKCLSYSKNAPYHPFVDILKAQFQIKDEDCDLEIIDKVKDGMQAIGIDNSDATPYFLVLLGVEDSGIDRSKISPEAQKERTINAFIRIVQTASRFRPLIVAIEDLHWIDKTSENVLAEMLENIPTEKILLIFTFRPQFIPTWRSKSYIRQVLLSNLSDRESLAMANHLLHTDQVGDELKNLIIEKTEGVPFFVEEFVRSLIDLSIIEKTYNGFRLRKNGTGLRIPTTIHDVIMTRVDALPETAKDILRTGSAIEREFGYELIKQTAGLSEEELSAGLDNLKNSELIYQRGIIPDSAYIFRHALIMETVYDSILSGKKINLHRRIGKVMESFYEENVDEHSASIARHFMEGGLHEKAAKYLRLAARKARRSGSYIDAIEYSRRRIRAIENLPETEEIQKQIIDARTDLATYCMAVNRHIEAKNTVDPIVDLTLRLNYKKKLPGLYIALGTYYMAIDEFDNAIQYLKQAIDAAQSAEDWLNFWYGNYFLGSTFSFVCQFEKAIEYHETSLKLSEMVNILPGICSAKGTMSGFTLCFHGKITSAYKLSEETVQSAEICGDAHTKGMAYSQHGSVCFFKGDFERSRMFFTQAIELCRKADQLTWKAWAEQWLGEMYFCLQKYSEAQHFFQQAISTMEAMDGQYPSWKAYHKLFLQRIIMAIGGKVNQPFPPPGYREQNKLKIIEGLIEKVLADILMRFNPPRIEEAESLIKYAINVDQKNGTRWYLARDYEMLSEICERKRDQAGAIASMDKAIEIMTSCGADGWVERYKRKIIELQR